jgi:hypothetical protein
MGSSEDNAGMVQVDLSDEEVAQRSAKLASEEIERELLLEKKRTHNREWNEQLKQANTRIAVLAKEVDSHQAWAPAQAALFGENDTEEEPEETPPPARRGRRGRRAAAEDGAAA